MRSLARHLLLFSLLAITASCQPSSPESASTSAVATQLTPPAEAGVDQTRLHHDIQLSGEQSLKLSLSHASRLLKATENFIRLNDDSHWQQLRSQWLLSHQQWHHSEVYLQLLPPSNELLDLRQRIHSAEITPGYLDYLEGYAHSGIVNDNSLEISLENLQQQHRRYSEEETALGIQVLEFFIWGRGITDYTESASPKQTQILAGLTAQQLPIPRRRLYLQLLAQQWLTDVETAIDYWQANSQSLPTADSIKLSFQQQLGALADNTHCLFSQDLQWRGWVIEAIAQHISANDNLSLLKQALQDEPEQSLLNQQLGRLMLEIKLSTKPQATL